MGRNRAVRRKAEARSHARQGCLGASASPQLHRCRSLERPGDDHGDLGGFPTLYRDRAKFVVRAPEEKSSGAFCLLRKVDCLSPHSATFPPVNALKELIESRLVTRKYCGITGENLLRCWPAWPKLTPRERLSRATTFAQKNGWIAKISATGDRLTFRKSGL